MLTVLLAMVLALLNIAWKLYSHKLSCAHSVTALSLTSLKQFCSLYPPIFFNNLNAQTPALYTTQICMSQMKSSFPSCRQNAFELAQEPTLVCASRAGPEMGETAQRSTSVLCQTRVVATTMPPVCMLAQDR